MVKNVGAMWVAAWVLNKKQLGTTVFNNKYLYNKYIQKVIVYLTEI